VVIIGDVDYRNFKKLELVMRRLVAGRGVMRVLFIIPDERGVGSQAITLCHDMGTHFLKVPKLLAHRQNGDKIRNGVILRELEPHVVLFFAHDLSVPHIEGVKNLADRAYKKGVKVVHLK
jgi:hypothetical protein